MPEKSDQQLATEAAARAGAAVNEPRDPTKVRSSIRAAAAAARAAIPTGAGKLNEPAIADAGTGVAAVPRTGAAPDSGTPAPAAPKPGTQEVPVVMVDDEEYDELEQGQGEGGQEPEGQPQPEGEGAAPVEGEDAEGAEGAPAPGEGGEPAPEGEGEPEGGWVAVEIPGRGPHGEPQVVDVEDPELAADLARLARGYIRREQLGAALEEVDRFREEQAQMEDVLQVDPINFVIERVRPELQVQLARALLAQPAVYNAIQQEFGGLEGAELQNLAIRIDNDRLRQRSETQRDLTHRSDARVQGRKIDGAIRAIIPDDMDQATAARLYNDLRRDVTEHITANRLPRLPVEELPAILEWRLAQYGITADYAAERLQDSGLPPLPVRARPARANGNGAPDRLQRQPARTGESVVAAADRRRAAAAIPGVGAGVAAQSGWVLPKKQRVKGRIASLREMLGLGG